MGEIELSAFGDDALLKMKRPQLKGDAMWKDVEDLINRWARKRPQQALDHDRMLQELRGVQKDKKWGFIDGPRDAKSGGTRLTVSLPQELIQYLEAFYPDIFSTKKSLTIFKAKFPKFVIPEGEK